MKNIRTLRSSDWINSYIKYTKDTEYPRPFHIWNAISTIAGALERKVFVRLGRFIVYPNLYIVLVGHSGLGKSASMKIAGEIVKELNIKVCAEAITCAELISYMMGSKRAFTNEEGLEEHHSSVHVMAKELAVLLGQHDLKLLTHLTDWFDSADEWRYDTKGSGKFFIEGVCLNIIGASAPDWFPTMIPIESMGGGFTSRIIFVYETQKEKILPFPPYTQEHEDMKLDLIADLQDIATFTGELFFDEDAKEAYSSYYIQQEENIKKGNYPIKDKDFVGYVSRRALILVKLAMVMAISRGTKGNISKNDFHRAWVILTKAEEKMPSVFAGTGRSCSGPIVNNIMEFIAQLGTVSKGKVINSFYRDISLDDLDVIERTLERMGFIKITIDGRNTVYEYQENWGRESKPDISQSESKFGPDSDINES